jgi:hypothetical protein
MLIWLRTSFREQTVMKVFALVRIHVPSTVHDKKRGMETTVTDHVWGHVVESHRKWHTKDVRLLYLTHRHMQEDTSLIVEAKDPDVLANFLLTHIATIENVRGIWVLPMAKMQFFEVPKDDTHGFPRFTITIDAIPKQLDRIREKISSLKPGRDIAINYIAVTFQSFRASIVVSVLARSRNHLDLFVERYIRSLEGVADAETTLISKTMRLVSPDEWKEYVGHLSVPAGQDRIEDIEAEDDSLISGC